MSELEAGIHQGIPMADYIADPAPEPSLSKGAIGDLVERSPAHVFHNHPRLGGRKDDGSSRADLGSAAHAVLLGGEEAIRYCDATYLSGKRKGEIVEDWTAKGAQEFQKDCRATNKIPMLERQRDELNLMLAAARPVLEKFGAGETESTLIWQEENGIWGRCRPDFLAEDRRVVVDYKTATNADPIAWIKNVLLKTHYDIQGAWNLRGLDQLLGKADRDFIFLVQEIEPPYLCSVIGLGPEMQELAERKIGAGLLRWKQCLETGEWPGYNQGTHWAEVPQYHVWDFETRLAAFDTP
jgi:hypothetical protein